MTLEELTEAIRHGSPPTPDDVSITTDGRRLDTKEKIVAWVNEINAERAAAENCSATLRGPTARR